MSNTFSDTVWRYYFHNKRDLPWRNIANLPAIDRGYRVIVSEFMLQQTQVSRVSDKYATWMQRWPTIDDFSKATLADVLAEWNGLGYNRRAKYLFETLRVINTTYNGDVPKDIEQLTHLPGIGKNTAAAIIVYTHNLPYVFIETNIRTVYLREFFSEANKPVTDGELLQKVTETIDEKNPREWFYALMDYGTYVKKYHGNQLHNATAHKKQSQFQGSKRQIRGRVLHILSRMQKVTEDELELDIKDGRLPTVLDNLITEGLISRTSEGVYSLPNR